jgi:hypothetical protein
VDVSIELSQEDLNQILNGKHLTKKLPGLEVKLFRNRNRMGGSKTKAPSPGKRLSQNLKRMILLGLQDAGKNAYYRIEEHLTIAEAKIAEEFLGWAFKDYPNRTIGHGNIDARYQEYLTSKETPDRSYPANWEPKSYGPEN